MKRISIAALIIFIVAVLLAAAGAYYWRMHKNGNSEAGQPQLPEQTITIGSARVVAEIAETDAERQAGLSGRAALPPGHGMLFVFDSDGAWGIWMPDMLFSIDILWMDSSGKIITIDSDVSPQTYPKAFYPVTPARYVLELPSGSATAAGLSLGDVMSLPKSR